MTNSSDINKINLLKQLYSTNKDAARMLNHMAMGINRKKETSVDDVAQLLGISRPKAMNILKLLSETGCATFRKGRKTENVQNPTRVEWIDHYAQIGKVARGELPEINAVTNAVLDDSLSKTAMLSPSSPYQPPAPLSIREAKRLLAESLGIDEANIDITVKG